MYVLRKHGILKKLRRNREIVILKPDKGNGVVIVDRKDYVDSIMKIVSDTGKFRSLRDDRALKCEGQLQRFLRKLKKENKISNLDYDLS